MKNTLILIPCALGLLLSGCAIPYDPVTGQLLFPPALVSPGGVVVATDAPDAVFYTDREGVPYYFVDGRYCYYRHGRRTFVDRLPHSGHLNRDYARHHADFVRGRDGFAHGPAWGAPGAPVPAGAPRGYNDGAARVPAAPAPVPAGAARGHDGLVARVPAAPAPVPAGAARGHDGVVARVPGAPAPIHTGAPRGHDGVVARVPAAPTPVPTGAPRGHDGVVARVPAGPASVPAGVARTASVGKDQQTQPGDPKKKTKKKADGTDEKQ